MALIRQFLQLRDRCVGVARLGEQPSKTPQCLVVPTGSPSTQAVHVSVVHQPQIEPTAGGPVTLVRQPALQ